MTKHGSKFNLIFKNKFIIFIYSLDFEREEDSAVEELREGVTKKVYYLRTCLQSSEPPIRYRKTGFSGHTHPTILDAYPSGKHNDFDEQVSNYISSSILRTGGLQYHSKILKNTGSETLTTLPLPQINLRCKSR